MKNYFKICFRQQCSESMGRSMIEMLGVLAIIGILTLAAFFGYQKAITRSRINKTIEAAALTLQKYADFTLRDVKNLSVTGENAVEDALVIGLSDTCQIVDSEIENGYKVCDVPLGEMYIKFNDKTKDRYSYMLFITLVDDDVEACAPFLTQGWDQIIPREWWPNTKIWIKSDSKEMDVYPQGGRDVTPGIIGMACDSVCKENEEYCTIIFDIADIRGKM